MIIIGIGHKAQNGKDTAGEAIVQHYATQAGLLRLHGMVGGLRVALMKFAGALYKEARELHSMTEKDPVLLQNIGMARRAEDPDYWVKRAFDAIPQRADIVVFTDVRFLNEAAAIKAKGGYLIGVTRLNEGGSRYFATDRPREHRSETELDHFNWDFQIVSKSPALTGEMAVTIAEYIRGLETK